MTSVDAILNGPDYFYCEHYRARLKKQNCIARQDAENNVKARQNPNTALAPNLQTMGCAGCAQGAQIREEMNMPSKKGICAGCGKERTLLAHEKCFSCNGYGENKKKASGGGKVEKKAPSVPAEMPPEKVKMRKEIKTKIRARQAEKVAAVDPLPIAVIEGKVATLLSPDPRIVILDFTLPENADLYEPWVKYGRSHRRNPGDQAMMAVEQILTNEGIL